MNVDIDLDETQAAIVEPVGKKRKEDDVTREMLDDAAKRAAKEVMKEMASENDKREQRLLNHIGDSVTKAVNKAASCLTSELHSRMQHWKSQIETLMKRKRKYSSTGTPLRKSGKIKLSSWSRGLSREQFPWPKTGSGQIDLENMVRQDGEGG